MSRSYASSPWRRPPRRRSRALTPCGSIPLTTILDAFSDHPVVALGEGAHGNIPGHTLRLALLRHPRFATIVNDIVVESGSARDQASIDAYIRGDDVPETVVREALENSAAAAPVWDRPMFVEFFRAVRDLNAGLPPERRIRVLLGDPPIDWATVKTPAAPARRPAPAEDAPGDQAAARLAA